MMMDALLEKVDRIEERTRALRRHADAIAVREIPARVVALEDADEARTARVRAFEERFAALEARVASLEAASPV